MDLTKDEILKEFLGLKMEYSNLKSLYEKEKDEHAQLAIEYQKSEAKYDNLVSSMIQGFALHEIICNDNGEPVDYRFLAANDSFGIQTGLNPEKIINKTALEILPGLEKYWIENYGNVALTGIPAHFENYSHELGKYYEVVAFSPSKNQFAVLISDITKHKHVDEELAEYHSRLELTMDSANIAWWEMDIITGDVIFHNRKTEMLGYRTENFKHYNDFMAIVHPDDYDNTMNAMKRHFEGKNDKYDCIYRILTNSGDYKWFHDIGGIVKRDSNGSPMKVTGIVVDITKRRQAEIKLSESEQKYRLFIESAQEGILVAQGDILKFVNPMMQVLTDYTKDELLSLPFSDLIHADDRELVKSNYMKRLKGESVDKRYHFRILNKDKSIKWVEVSGVKMEWEGKPATLNFLNDITERKISEELLRHRERHLRKAEEVAKLGNWTLYLTEKIIKSSDNASIIYGFENNINTLNKVQSIVLQEYRPALDRALIDLIEFNKPFEIEYKIQRENDNKIIDIYSKAEYDIFNNIVFGIIQDISERKLAEESIRESEKHLQAVFNIIGTGILLINSENLKIIDVNDTACLLMGYPKDEIIGKACNEYFCQNIIGQCPVKDLKRTVDKSERKMLCANNIQKDILKSVYPIKYKGINCYLESFMDISEIKDKEKELKRLNLDLTNSRDLLEVSLYQKNSLIEELSRTKVILEQINSEKDKFFSIIAHDLKSPFSGFLGLTKIMAEEINDLTMSEMQNFAINLQKSAKNLYKLLSNLLEWSQIQRGIIDFNPVICNLSFLIKQNFELIYDFAKQKDIELINTISEDYEIYADIPMINTVIRNLLSNAVKFTQRGGKVEIGTKNFNDTKIDLSNYGLYNMIYVKDTGIGMDRDTIEKLFKVDEKVTRPGTEGELSTGLGLILCNEFVKVHSGLLWVESEIKKGSTFYFTLAHK